MLTTPPPERRRARAFAAGILLLVAAAAPYAPFLDVYFLKDDLNLLQLADADGRASFEAYKRWFGWPRGVYAHDEFYRPLPTLLAYAEFATFGPNPAAFRVSNVVVHAFNALLLALLVDRLTERRRGAAALFCGLLFAVHPAHPEAVVWITQRFVTHQTFWTLLGLLAVDAWIRRGGRATFVAASLAALAAALSKETAAVMPALYGLYGLTASKPAEAPRPRMRAAFGAAAAGLSAPFAVIGFRFALFGTFEGTYAGVPIAVYAATRRTFERLPQSLLDGLRGVNSYAVGETTRTILGIAFALAALAALVILVRGLKDPLVRRAALFGLGFAAASLAPMTPIFYCDPWLAGARFLYQPIAGLAIVAFSGTFASGDRKPALAVPAGLAVVFALALSQNLAVYRGADAQIRGVRDGLARAAEARPEAAFVLHGVPAEFKGVPTVDLYAPLLARPPLGEKAIDVFPIVSGMERFFDGPGYARFLERVGRRPLEHLVWRPTRSVVAPMFPARLAGEGVAPKIAGPPDGAILFCPDQRAAPPEIANAPIPDEPTISFAPADGAARYRLVVRSTEASFDRSPEPRTFSFTLRPGIELMSAANGFSYTFSSGAPEAPPNAPDLWRALATFGFEPPPLLIVWSIEALDAKDRAIGISEERRLVVYPTSPPSE